MGTADVVCDWIDKNGVAQHHETHWAGELGTAPVASVADVFNFGGVKVGQLSANHDVQLTNIGNAPMHVTSAVLSGVNASDFNVVADSCTGATLAAGSSCAVTTRFVPAIGAIRQAKITFTDDSVNAPGTTQVTTLKGLGLEPLMQLTPLVLDFGSQRILTNAVKTITASNNGTDALNIAAFSISGASDFKIVSDSCSKKTLLPGAGCSVTVRFSPMLIGSKTATVSVSSNAPANNAHTIAVKGTGTVI